jgi:hypothetical protein
VGEGMTPPPPSPSQQKPLTHIFLEVTVLNLFYFMNRRAVMNELQLEDQKKTMFKKEYQKRVSLLKWHCILPEEST